MQQKTKSLNEIELSFKIFKERHPKPVLCYLDFLLIGTTIAMAFLMGVTFVDIVFLNETLQKSESVYETSTLAFIVLSVIFYKISQYLYAHQISKKVNGQFFIDNVKFCNESIYEVFTETNLDNKAIRLSKFLEDISNNKKMDKKEALYFLTHMDAYYRQLENRKKNNTEKAFLNKLLNK